MPIPDPRTLYAPAAEKHQIHNSDAAFKMKKAFHKPKPLNLLLQPSGYTNAKMRKSERERMWFDHELAYAYTPAVSIEGGMCWGS
jgi:hypothetical protein